jgi:CheY-like chemotaxis protein/uncharacterized C2H2 Zn-finger protein
MIQEVIIEERGGRIVFSCPSCQVHGAFGSDIVSDITDENIVRNCPRCGTLVVFKKPAIESAVKTLLAQNPELTDPLREFAEEEFTDFTLPSLLLEEEDEETPIPEGGLILVLDHEESLRYDIKEVFSGIANVEAHGASLGAVRFIRKWLGFVTLILMDVFLGDGTCFDVLDRLKAERATSTIPVIVVSRSEEDTKIIKKSLSFYPQLKFVIQREDLVKKLTGLSEAMKRKIQEKRE